jgi:phytoene dehydrogenase-like protein
VIEAVIQSTTDPSLSTPGRHTSTLGVQQLPYDIRGGWDARKQEFTARVLDYGLTEGNIFHGAMFLDQLFGSRPLPEHRSSSVRSTFDQWRTARRTHAHPPRDTDCCVTVGHVRPAAQ